MPELGLPQFAAFVREVSGFDPFPWQQRLMATVLTEGWPSLLDLPTGTGKTTTLLIGIYALAVAPERSHRRVALVVDRRIIVDQVTTFAEKLGLALKDDEKPVCRQVAARLRSLCSAPGPDPVRVVHLRGGIPRDDSWLGAPDQPTIIASTVDQVGSRLLFRGYGVSENMRPVHAGVLARDTLYLLDEVHLATAFEETLGHLEQTYASWAEHGGVGRPLRFVRMSATPRADERAAATKFALDDDDRAHAVLARRLGASRPAVVQLVKTKRPSTDADTKANHQRLAEAASVCVNKAIANGARAVGVVVNRVDTARRVAALLRLHDGLRVELITGRMRPFDKNRAQDAIAQMAGAGVAQEPNGSPGVVVATSCIEAGADLDFDALITEVASFDALRQRFGRCNRLGNHSRVHAWILGCKHQLGGNAKPDPVYGDALRETWNYLAEVADDNRVDFGLEALPMPGAAKLRTLVPEVQEAPVLFPAYLDMWSETRPAPYPDPDVALWLHGKDREPERDVHVVFRADLPPPDATEEVVAMASDAVEFLAPVAEEAVAVGMHDFRRWFDDDDDLVWRWQAQGLELVRARAARPGDTLVVPAQRGGLLHGTWDPDSHQAVVDVAEPATFNTRGILKLRMCKETLPHALAAGVPQPPSADTLDDLELARDECHRWLDELDPDIDDVPEQWRHFVAALVKALKGPRRSRRLSITSVGARPIWQLAIVPRQHALEGTTEDSVSSFGGKEVTLDVHLEDVRQWAAAFGRSAGLEPDVASDLALAALLHDMGKADPRFQAMLRGGDPIAPALGEPLAKSPIVGTRATRERARIRSGWPRGFRHELVSLALLDASEPLKDRAVDLDLVRHLVASHHGWCRPWIPSEVDPTPIRVDVVVDGVAVEATTAAIDGPFGAECASRFRRLCRRYGWHGLAYLEALLRLGDHRASESPTQRPEVTS